MLLATKLRNMVQKLGNYEIKLNNISINGRKIGCSGFITNPVNGKIVFVSTEKPAYAALHKKNLIRYAKSTSDYAGGINHFVEDDRLCNKIVEMLKQRKKGEKNE